MPLTDGDQAKSVRLRKRSRCNTHTVHTAAGAESSDLGRQENTISALCVPTPDTTRPVGSPDFALQTRFTRAPELHRR